MDVNVQLYQWYMQNISAWQPPMTDLDDYLRYAIVSIINKILLQRDPVPAFRRQHTGFLKIHFIQIIYSGYNIQFFLEQERK